jgi:hypothetical protein
MEPGERAASSTNSHVTSWIAKGVTDGERRDDGEGTAGEASNGAAQAVTAAAMRTTVARMARILLLR